MIAAAERTRGEDGFTLVELLVVLIILSVVGGATASLIISTTRSNAFTEEMREVMEDGRVSLDRVRKELRGGRRVLDGSDAYRLRWWVDQNQDGLQQTSEIVNYCVADLGSTTCKTASATGQFELIRWDEAESQMNATVIARTLTSTDVFSGLQADVTETTVVNVTFHLEVTDTDRGPGEIQLSAAIRLRNVA